MSSNPSAPGGLELVWVNASPAGPTRSSNTCPENIVFRIQYGQSKTISRSSSALNSPVNDLSSYIHFPLAKVVSRKHAVVQWLDGEPFVANLGSTHGTYVAHRQAVILPTGQVVEGSPLAPLQPVVGALALFDGDLIEFGKSCSRSHATYHPVRCYVKTLATKASPGLGSRISSTETEPATIKPFSLIDDPLDSESDIVSIDAETFHTGTPLPDLHSTLSTLPTIRADVVDLTSDDDAGSESLPPTSDPESDNSEGTEGSDLHDRYADGDDHVDSESDSSIDFSIDSSIDCFEDQQVPWYHEIHEAAREKSELDREASEARQEGEKYMAAYKAKREIKTYSPATSDDCELSVFDKVMSDSPPAIKLAEVMRDSIREETGVIAGNKEAETGATTDLLNAKSYIDRADSPAQPSSREPSGAPSPAMVDTAVVVEQAQPKKRKVDQTTEGDSTEDLCEANSDACSEVSSLSSSTPSSPCILASNSPSPSKKRRVSHLKHHLAKDSRRPARAPSRGRIIRTFVMKAMYTTSLLSIGFLTGSLFTFKSMMNAAAAANAAGSRNQ